jgi:hypothetical protein
VQVDDAVVVAEEPARADRDETDQRRAEDRPREPVAAEQRANSPAFHGERAGDDDER